MIGGWSQLTEKEFNEFIEQEAFASHIGQFIHKGMPLDVLRRELPTLKTLEWITIEDGKKTPVDIEIHHDSSKLLEIHNKFAELHRQFESKVNYYKAKVKNLTTDENARIAAANAKGQEKVNNSNSKLRDAYKKDMDTWNDDKLKARQDFEVKRQKEISKTANLRIVVSPLFKETIDMYLAQLNPSQEVEDTEK